MHFKSCHLFQELSELQASRLLEISIRMPIEKDQWLFREGDEAGVFYVLEKGAVELFTLVNDKFELPIAMLNISGSAFGLAALVQPFTYNVSARCAEAGEVFEIERIALEGLVRDDHQLGCTIMSNLARHLFNRLRETRRELKVHFKSLFLLTH